LVLQIPLGAQWATFPKGQVLCGPVPAGFEVDVARHRFKPAAEAEAGYSLAVVLAADTSACKSANVADTTLVVTGELPTIDAGSVTVALDAGRLELRGQGLEGIRISYRALNVDGDIKAGEEAKVGEDVCLNIDRELCAVNIDRSLPADPHRIELRWAPPKGRAGEDVLTYDKRGVQIDPEQTRMTVARLLISRMIPEARMVDLARGAGKVALIHPEAVSGADCGVARCEVNPEGLLVSRVPASVSKLPLRLQLLPRVFFARQEVLDNVIGDTLTLLRCASALVSGQPLRNVDELRVLLRLDPACAGEPSKLHFMANAEPADLLRTEASADGVYVLLGVGRLSSERLTLLISRDDGSVVSVVSERSAAMPPVIATLSLAGYGEIPFIPRNRPAFVNVTHIAGTGELVPVSVPGAYVVSRTTEGYHVRGVYAAGGYAALRFAYRVSSLPPAFADTDFGLVTDPVQRPIREASIPAPIGASSVTDHALVELYCKGAEGTLTLVPPGSPIHIPFSERESCRLILHRERIPPESGQQRLDVDVSVTDVSGTDRAEAHRSEHLTLRHSGELDVIWIRGAKDQFDRISVRITHVIDESLFDDEVRRRLELPSSQWTVVTENAHFKFYATAAIPASLYRFSTEGEGQGSGTLSLNLGLLSRLTWLNRDGHEGLLALEAGVMGMGLADQAQRQLAIVGGLGVAIPLGNANQPTQASVNIHMWMSYTLGRLYGVKRDPLTGAATSETSKLNPVAFIFGPSITVGNIGALL